MQFYLVAQFAVFIFKFMFVLQRTNDVARNLKQNFFPQNQNKI